MKLRDYQVTANEKALPILNQYGHVVLNFVCRAGKTHTSLALAELYGAKSVLFITKKNAIPSIQEDYDGASVSFTMQIINIESIHKIIGTYDLVIYDEYHSFGYIQKPMKKNKLFEKYRHLPMISITATLFTETFSTAYSLFPREFSEYRNFYQWYGIFGDLKTKQFGQLQVKDYSRAHKTSIFKRIDKYIVSITQDQAGFNRKVENRLVETFCPEIDKLTKLMKRDKVICDYVADSIAKEFSAICQLAGGTLKLDDTHNKIFSTVKIERIYEDLKDKKIAIYYKYKAEKTLIEAFYGDKGYTVSDDIDVFKASSRKSVYIGQFRSKREGVKLDFINDIVFYGMPFSNLDYLQSKERILSVEKEDACTCHIYITGLEKKIHDVVVNKKGKFNLESYKRG